MVVESATFTGAGVAADRAVGQRYTAGQVVDPATFLRLVAADRATVKHHRAVVGEAAAEVGGVPADRTAGKHQLPLVDHPAARGGPRAARDAQVRKCRRDAGEDEEHPVLARAADGQGRGRAVDRCRMMHVEQRQQTLRQRDHLCPAAQVEVDRAVARGRIGLFDGPPQRARHGAGGRGGVRRAVDGERRHQPAVLQHQHVRPQAMAVPIHPGR